MNVRILPRDEWARVEPDLAALLEKCPAEAEVYAVEKAGRMVGCVAALRVTHLEGLWVAPELRGNAGLWRRLLGVLDSVTARWGLVFAGANTDCMRRLLERLGASRMPMDSYLFRRF